MRRHTRRLHTDRISIKIKFYGSSFAEWPLYIALIGPSHPLLKRSCTGIPSIVGTARSKKSGCLFLKDMEFFLPSDCPKIIFFVTIGSK